MKQKFNRLRDTIAMHGANLSLKIATKNYRDLILGAMLYGLSSAARDSKEGRESPDGDLWKWVLDCE